MERQHLAVQLLLLEGLPIVRHLCKEHRCVLLLVMAQKHLQRLVWRLPLVRSALLQGGLVLLLVRSIPGEVALIPVGNVLQSIAAQKGMAELMSTERGNPPCHNVHSHAR